MSYVKCHDCDTTIHVRPLNVEAFEKRFVEGNEPVYCLFCFNKRKEEQKEKE